MSMLFRAVALVTAALILLPSTSAGGDPAQPITVAGSGANLAAIRLLSRAFMAQRPGLTINVPDSIGSSGGIRAAVDGAIDLGLVSRPLRADEASLGLSVVPYARTGIVIGAHPTVTDDDVTFDDLVAIFRGTKTRWSDGRNIIVLTREPGDSSIEVLEARVPGFKEAYRDSQRANRWTMLTSDQEMNRILAKTAHALGLSDLGTIVTERLPIKPLRVNGVAPSTENIASGRYRLVKTLAFVVRPETLRPPAKAFMDFAGSREGQRLLAANGFLPAVRP